MHFSDNNAIVQYHRQRMGLPNVQPLGWRDEHTQSSRFAALCDWGDMSECSILDLGCGYGDLKLFLDERFHQIEYTGVDLLPEFIVIARERYGHLPSTHFIQMDFAKNPWPLVDIVLASGSLNYRSSDAAHPFPIIRHMWERARKGIAFNLLDIHKQAPTDILQSYDPQTILAFCRQLDPDAELVMDYHPEDFTLRLRKTITAQE